MPKKALLLLSLSGMCTASLADNCEAIASQIEAKLRAGGIAAPRLVSIERSASPGGRVVGSCASGSKQIVLLGGAAAAAGDPAATPRLRPVPADNIITECKDGRVVRGPDCSRPPPRPRPPAASAPANPAAPATPVAPAASAATTT